MDESRIIHDLGVRPTEIELSELSEAMLQAGVTHAGMMIYRRLIFAYNKAKADGKYEDGFEDGLRDERSRNQTKITTRDSDMPKQLCEGEMHGSEATCPGPAVLRVHARRKGDTEWFSAWWCKDCRELERSEGTEVKIISLPERDRGKNV